MKINRLSCDNLERGVRAHILQQRLGRATTIAAVVAAVLGDCVEGQRLPVVDLDHADGALLEVRESETLEYVRDEFVDSNVSVDDRERVDDRTSARRGRCRYRRRWRWWTLAVLAVGERLDHDAHGEHALDMVQIVFSSL